ncbi:hypothetical protein RFI_08034 [Reticulomyxa filosa]|uniref:Uncharacterized protein n=1 Tax=Reticulomyxa filosa TaxID=46433 RepID=X6NTK4_RETFI|nr:hypothetical protein RFI_08034 [Reticulomyxa filosa]|eukprot:ETO29089.1 hypothetical protein RFI_08034 [Reticulomyxa filosa]
MDTSENKCEEFLTTDNTITFETLNSKKHWSKSWIDSNVEAAKIVNRMVEKNEQGLIVITNNTSEWKNKIHSNANKNSTYTLINDNNLEDKKKQCLQEKLFDNALIYAQQNLQICIDNFGSNHPFVADLYTFLGIICGEWDKIFLHHFGINHPWIANICDHFGNGYDKNKQYDEAIEYYIKALVIRIKIFGVNHPFVACSYDDLGIPYFHKGQHDKAIECHEKALKIKKTWNINKNVADSYWNIGYIYQKIGKDKTACTYFEESWKIYNSVLGEWNEETLTAKKEKVPSLIYSNMIPFECMEKDKIVILIFILLFFKEQKSSKKKSIYEMKNSNQYHNNIFFHYFSTKTILVINTHEKKNV